MDDALWSTPDDMRMWSDSHHHSCSVIRNLTAKPKVIYGISSKSKKELMEHAMTKSQWQSFVILWHYLNEQNNYLHQENFRDEVER